MPLSDEEARLLHQLEQSLAAEDPDFASTLRGSKFMAHNRRTGGRCCPRLHRRPRAAVRRGGVGHDLAGRARIRGDALDVLPVPQRLQAWHRQSRGGALELTEQADSTSSSTAWRSAGSAAATEMTSRGPTSLHLHHDRPLGGGFSLPLRHFPGRPSAILTNRKTSEKCAKRGLWWGKVGYGGAKWRTSPD